MLRVAPSLLVERAPVPGDSARDGVRRLALRRYFDRCAQPPKRRENQDAGDGIRRAKERNNLGRVTQSLFFATDFIDRLEKEIVPALRAGFIVLTDRYIYSRMARAIVRGMDANWIRSIFGVALRRDAVFILPNMV